MTLDELERCVGILLQVASDWGVTTAVPGNRDMYWTIGSPDWLQLSPVPKPGVGSFHDDQAERKGLLDDPSRASSVDLQRAAHLLLLVAEQMMQPEIAEGDVG